CLERLPPAALRARRGAGARDPPPGTAVQAGAVEAGRNPPSPQRMSSVARVPLRAAAAAYLVPLLALLAGYLVLSAFLARLGMAAGREAFAIAGGFACLALSYLWLRSYDRRRGDRLTPRMIAVVEPPAASGEPPEPPR
ncbi:MAG: SoxR reducing system RseC family protein, partial [Firmicutes bacterium]|nr:SoxR reducing system RseC family protein [Bacillota bacterium]